MFKKESDIFNERISKIREFATRTAPAMAGKITSADQYMQDIRMPLNLSIMELLLGATFEQKGDKMKIKYNHRVPNKSQLAQVVDLLSTYINDVETPFIEDLNAYVVNLDVDDMGAPGGGADFDIYESSIPTISKIDKRQMKGLVFGEGMNPVCNSLLTPSDICALAGMGEELKKKIVRNEILIASGITVAVVAAGVGTYMYIDHKKKERELAAIEAGEDPDIDIDVPSVSLDAPHVEYLENGARMVNGRYWA